MLTLPLLIHLTVCYSFVCLSSVRLLLIRMSFINLSVAQSFVLHLFVILLFCRYIHCLFFSPVVFPPSFLVSSLLLHSPSHSFLIRLLIRFLTSLFICCFVPSHISPRPTPLYLHNCSLSAPIYASESENENKHWHTMKPHRMNVQDVNSKLQHSKVFPPKYLTNNKQRNRSNEFLTIMKTQPAKKEIQLSRFNPDEEMDLPLHNPTTPATIHHLCNIYIVTQMNLLNGRYKQTYKTAAYT